MKYLALIVVLAIVYGVYVNRSSPHSTSSAIAEGMAASQMAGVAATPTPAPGAQPVSSLRQPIDRTRELVKQVQSSRAGNEF